MIKSADNTLIVFGGFVGGNCVNDIWTYSPSRKEWKKLTPASKTCPPQRANHAAALWHSSKGDMMVIFGGTTETLDRLNDLWVFNIEKKTWDEVIPKPEEKDSWPVARSEHSISIYNNILILFGGRSSAMKELNDVLILNLLTMKWKKTSALCLQPSPDKSFAYGVNNSPTIDKSSGSGVKGEASFSNAAIQMKDNNKPVSPSSNRKSPTTAGKQGDQSPISPSKTHTKKLQISPKKLRVAEIESALAELKLLSPTTSMMLNSVVMRAGERGLEQYGLNMRKKKRVTGLFALTKPPEAESEYIVRGRIPCARSGHSAEVFAHYMIIFGGDRCQVALNDIYVYDLAREAL